jgi:hypothetical protein
MTNDILSGIWVALLVIMVCQILQTFWYYNDRKARRETLD